MWIKGGNAVWGNGMHAPDDECNATHSHGQLIAFRQSQLGTATGKPSQNMTADEASEWILEHTPSTFQVRSLKSRLWNCSWGWRELMDTIRLTENDRDELFVWN